LKPALHQLADLYSIKTSYLDVRGRVRPASGEALLAALRALGAPVASFKDVPAAIRTKRLQDWQQPLEPVSVIWGGEVRALNLRLTADLIEKPIAASLTLDTGEKKSLLWRTSQSSVLDSIDLEGTRYVTVQLYLPEAVPFGYHNLELDLPGQTARVLIISAPLKAYSPRGDARIWGVFLPLYSLHTRRSWGAGDFSDLSAVLEWASTLGGSMVGTLPLLPSFFNDKIGPSPYMPASRLFWNEFYLDISRIPELENCSKAQSLIDSPDFQEEIRSLHSAGRAEYRRQYSLKRKVLEELLEYCLAAKSERYATFRQYIDSNSLLEEYACFRAAGERHGIDWHKWPQRMRDGRLNEGDYLEKSRQFHLYAQWLAQEQIQSLCQKARRDKTHLYLDLPVGVHPRSYDVWRDRDSFIMDASGGAPPDPVFTSGQNWSFPPIHPERIRTRGYRYIIQSLQHQLEQVSMLRIDHMMHFHRLFCIPEGMENREGVYIGYKADELYAILTLESYRHQSIIIGEDLGMVPPEVRPMMEAHGIYRMFVGQYELIAENTLGKIPPQAVASLNTHDIFPFAAFWQERDILARQKLKLINEKLAQEEILRRRQIMKQLIRILQDRSPDKAISGDTGAILRELLNLLAASPAYALLVNLEDLWLETRPQNTPGTKGRQNWTQKARFSFEEFSQMPQVVDVLRQMDRTRRGVGGI
jgi:4-alpha-glucanotransferase